MYITGFQRFYVLYFCMNIYTFIIINVIIYIYIYKRNSHKFMFSFLWFTFMN